MKVLIAVMTCARDRWRVPFHRKMLAGHGAAVRFFLGKQEQVAVETRPRPHAEKQNEHLPITPAAEDEIFLDERDDYDYLPHKVRAAFRWALEHGYDYIFKCDADTFVDVPQLLASGFEGWNYIGLMGDEGAGGGLAHCPSGGVGYWLSARAVRAYLEHYPVYGAGHPGAFHRFEDWCLAIVLHDYVQQTGDTSLRPHHDPRYWNEGALAWKFGSRAKRDCITWHPWKPEVKTLIAVSSCGDFEANGNNQTMRECWLHEASANGFDYKFFHGQGQGAQPKDDVVLLDVPDDYGHLSYKSRANRAWAKANGYDFVFQCFPDTYCRPERLAVCGFESHDYYGDFRGEHATPDNYPSGGPGYFQSRKAYELLIDAPILGVWRDDITPYAEDLWGGQILNRHRDLGLRYCDNPNFVNRGTSHPGPLRSNTIISTHLSCPERYHAGRMREKHQEWLASAKAA